MTQEEAELIQVSSFFHLDTDERTHCYNTRHRWAKTSMSVRIYGIDRTQKVRWKMKNSNKENDETWMSVNSILLIKLQFKRDVEIVRRV